MASDDFFNDARVFPLFDSNNEFSSSIVGVQVLSNTNHSYDFLNPDFNKLKDKAIFNNLTVCQKKNFSIANSIGYVFEVWLRPEFVQNSNSKDIKLFEPEDDDFLEKFIDHALHLLCNSISINYIPNFMVCSVFRKLCTPGNSSK